MRCGGRAGQAAVVLLTAGRCAADTGSVYWEWWEPTADQNCTPDAQVQHTEWTSDNHCLHSAMLQLSDPLREIPRQLFPERHHTKDAEVLTSEVNIHGMDVDVHCVHFAGLKRTLASSAKEDVAVITIYNSTDLTCRDKVFEMRFNSSVCGWAHNFTNASTEYNVATKDIENAAGAVRNLRLTCSRCAWYFLGEAAPPYVLQGGGVFVFLVAVIIINLVLQAYLDRLLKTLPPKYLPCLFPPPDVIGPQEIRAGVLVELVGVTEADSGLVISCDPSCCREPVAPRGYRVRRDPVAEDFIDARLGRLEEEGSSLSPMGLFGGLGGFGSGSVRGDHLQVRTVMAVELPVATAVGQPDAVSEAGDFNGPIADVLAGSASRFSEPASPGSATGMLVWVESWAREAGQEPGTGALPRPGAGSSGSRSRPSSNFAVDHTPGSPHSGWSGASPLLSPQGSQSRRHHRHGHGRGTRRQSSLYSAAAEWGSAERPQGGDAHRSETAPWIRSARRYRSAQESELDSPRQSSRWLSGGPDSPGDHRYTSASVALHPRHGWPGHGVRDPAARYEQAYDGACSSSSRVQPAVRKHPDRQAQTPADSAVLAYSEHRAPAGAAATPHPMCIVCGRDDRPAERYNTPIDYRCCGQTDRGKFNCEAEPIDPVLHSRQGGFEDVDVQNVALEGQFGITAHCLGTFDGKCLCAFRRPRAWLRAAIVARIRFAPMNHELRSLGDKADKKKAACQWDNRWPTHVVVPKDAGSDGVAEQVWMRLCENLGFSIAVKVGGWCAVELLRDACVWIPRDRLRKLADWGGDHARLPVRDSLKNVFEEVGEGLWHQWYRDFELVVGRVRRVLGPLAQQDVRVRMWELECEGVRKVAEHRRGVQMSPKPTPLPGYLVLMSFAGSASFLVPPAALVRSNAKEENAEYLVVPQPITTRLMMAVFVASTPPLLACKGVALMVLFGLSINEATAEGHSGRANNHSPWQAYEEVYFKLFNSGYPTLLADCGTVSAYFIFTFEPLTKAQFVNGVGAPVLCLLVVAVSISFPGIMTHALPMVFYYCWFWAPILLFIYGIVLLVKRFRPVNPEVPEHSKFDLMYYVKHHKTYLARTAGFYLFFRVLAELAVVVFLQTNYNYAVLRYEGLASYSGAITTEFNHRQLQCTFENTKKIVSLII
eukprot:TRINITY_DN12515_c0_g1_i1.p1 TRINITY_DN12515_c0_g1~~TRINITY_DN12515_c0_g1_i1.p1  ORF type:complete len:1163 (+),score=116.23 TRINITY_DN12515_c0_g1_i1:83-3571(+)